MLKKHDIKLIVHLRNDSRKKVTRIAQEEKTPATTMYDRLKVHQKKFIKRHTALLDFAKLGLNAKAHITIKVGRDTREELRRMLIEHPNVNSLYQINTGHDFLAECVFKDLSQQRQFVEELQGMNAELTVYNEVSELKKEEFLTKEEHMEVLR